MFKKNTNSNELKEAEQNVTEAVENAAETVAENAEAAENEVKETAAKIDVFKKSMDDDENRKGVYIDKAESEAFLEAQRKRKKRNKIITTVVTLAIVLLLLFIIYKVLLGGNKGLIKWPDEFLVKGSQKAAGEVIPNDSDEMLIATKEKNGKKTEMYFSPKDSLMRLVISKDGVTEEYRSWPEPLENEVNPATADTKYPKFAVSHDIISSLVRVNYSEAQMDGGKDFGINQIAGVKIEYMKIENGFKARYTVPTTASKTDMDFNTQKYDFTFTFTVDFYLDDEANLISVVPVDEIVEPNWKDYASIGFKEDEMPKIATVSPLPYMMAARQGDEGSYITPDGSGSITNFASTRITQYDEYVKRIYGYDDTFDSFTYPNMTNEVITMPVYGVVKGNSMVTVFVNEGEANTNIVMGQPGMRSMNIYYIDFMYKIREYYKSSVGTGGSYTFCETNIGVGDFVEKFIFDIKPEGEKFTYVDVAKNARNLIIDKWTEDGKTRDYLEGAKLNVTADTNTDNDLVNLKIFFNDVNQASVHLFSQFKVMTTFEQAKDIIADASAEGRAKIHYSLLGWQQDGYFGNIMKKYGIESKLGGKSGLKELNSFAKESGIDTAADLNMLIYYSAPTKGATLRNSTVKLPSTIYQQYKMVSNAGVYKKRDNCYYMSPLYYEEKLLEKDIKNIAKLGFENVDLQQMGDLLYTDYNKENALLRIQALEHYRKWIVEYKKQFENVGIYGGFDYAASVADSIYDISTETSQIFIIDEAIPFVQIVYHGLVDYYSEAINRSSDDTASLLKSIEYGAFFTYEVTNNPTDDLRYTNYNSLFKAQYSTLSQDIKNAYVLADKVLAPVANSFIVNHTKLTPNVFCTEYDNNIQIYVNYASTDYTSPAGVVPAKGVLVVSNGTGTPVNVG